MELVLNKIDGVDTLRRRRLANRFPGALQVSAPTGEGLDALRAADRGALRRSLRGGAAARAVRRRRQARRAVRARRADRGARGQAGGRPRPRAAAAGRAAPVRAATWSPRRSTSQSERRRALRRDRAPRSGACARRQSCLAAPTRATRASTSPPAIASCWARGSGRSWEPGSRSEIPDGYAGFVLPRSGLAADHGLGSRERARA